MDLNVATIKGIITLLQSLHPIEYLLNWKVNLPKNICYNVVFSILFQKEQCYQQSVPHRHTGTLIRSNLSDSKCSGILQNHRRGIKKKGGNGRTGKPRRYSCTVLTSRDLADFRPAYMAHLGASAGGSGQKTREKKMWGDPEVRRQSTPDIYQPRKFANTYVTPCPCLKSPYFYF
jgi:hypothetical protein